jgi:RNA polymerase sigma factor (sigma-70 family)
VADEMEEKELVRACIERNPKAQKRLYDQFSSVVMGICIRYAGNRDEAKDVFQECFIKIFQKMHQYSGEGSLGGWIRSIAVNTSLIHIRKNQQWAHMADIDNQYDLKERHYGVLEEMAAGEIAEMIEAMPTGYRTVFNLYAIEGYQHKEIGEMLGISENTSKTQFMKAKAYMVKQLESTKTSSWTERIKH